MRKLLLALLGLVGSRGLVLAENATPSRTPIVDASLTKLVERELVDAAAAERDAGTRVSYYAAVTTIAERDLLTAQLKVDTARRSWDFAVNRHDADAAGDWAQRHAEATAEEREVRGRLLLNRSERDLARAEFQRCADDLHRIAVKVARVQRATRG
jgi:hypothetical protein